MGVDGGNLLQVIDYYVDVILESCPVPIFLKKNQNASRPSEHPPVRGENYCYT